MTTENTDLNSPTTALEPEGRFRWLHDRRTWHRPRYVGSIAIKSPRDWSPETVVTMGRNELTALVPDNTWIIGIFGNTALLNDYWPRLTPLQRGQAIAGLSEREDSREWVETHLADCRFDALSATQTACNALMDNSAALVQEVISRCDDLGGHVTRFCLAGIRSNGRFDLVVRDLSPRAVDIILEAAILAKSDEAVRLLLSLGADPNIPVWRLEKSYNERHCALSQAIDLEADDIALQLLAAGAQPQGTAFCTPNLPLYQAIAKNNRALAVALLERGASFANLDPGLERAITIERVRKANPRLIQPHTDYFFGWHAEVVSFVQRHVGQLIKLVPIWEKQSFYEGSGQGGQWRTFLCALGEDVASIKFFEGYGLDTRLAAEELLELQCYGFDDALAYLLPKQKALTPLTGEALQTAVTAALAAARDQQ